MLQCADTDARGRFKSTIAEAAREVLAVSVLEQIQ